MRQLNQPFAAIAILLAALILSACQSYPPIVATASGPTPSDIQVAFNATDRRVGGSSGQTTVKVRGVQSSLQVRSANVFLQEQFDIHTHPPHPTIEDDIRIEMSGEWPANCVPEYEYHQIDRHDIVIIGRTSFEVCAPVLTRWSFDVHIGQLEAGEYNIRGEIEDPNGETLAESVARLEVLSCCPDTGTITGKVLLQGRSAHSGAIISVDGHQGTTNPTGDFAVEVSQGTYTIIATMPGYLAAIESNVTVEPGQEVFLPDVMLRGGDADSNEEIGIPDLVLISAHLNTCSGDPDFDSQADINGDGCITIIDLVIASTNFRLKGPIAWPTTIIASYAR